MPNTKNALIRYYYLDRLLSDRHHYYDRNMLTQKVNQMLFNDGYKEVTKRRIELDINDLKSAPFNAPIFEFKYEGKRIVRYDEPSFSLFKKEMTDEEKELLREVLNTIGQFDGLDNFKWLDSLQKFISEEFKASGCPF